MNPTTDLPYQAKANNALKALWGFWTLSLTMLALSQLINLPEAALTPSLIVTGLLFWSFKALPLLVAMPFIKHRSHTAATWLAYACLVYFIIWVLVGFTEERELLGIAGSVATTGLFISCALFVRFEKQRLAFANKATPKDTVSSTIHSSTHTNSTSANTNTHNTIETPTAEDTTTTEDTATVACANKPHQ